MFLLPDIVKERLEKVKNYRVYFGEPVREMREDAKKIDMLIVDPYLYTKKQVSELQKQGILLIGSINIIEMPYKEHLEDYEEEDYYIEEGEKVLMLDTASYVMNLPSPHYRYLLMKEISEQIIKKGFNGVLFVGEINEIWQGNRKEQLKQEKGYFSFLRQVKNRFKMLPIFVQWNPYCKYDTLFHVDGIVWEYFQFDDFLEFPEELNALRTIYRYKKDNFLMVCTIAMVKSIKSEEFAKRMGFLYYQENHDFRDW